MHEAEFSKFSVSLIGEEGSPRKKGDFSNLTFEKLCAWINRMQISEEVKKECVLILKKYPHSALKSFVQNFQNVHLRIAQANARKKLRENDGDVELGEEGYVGTRKNDDFDDKKEQEQAIEGLLDLPKTESQTDFFPEVKKEIHE